MKNLLLQLAYDTEMLEIGRKAIEDALVDYRDAGLAQLRNNGFTIKGRDGSPSSTIRFGPEQGLVIALKAMAQSFDEKRDCSLLEDRVCFDANGKTFKEKSCT